MNSHYNKERIYSKIREDVQNTICFDCGLNDITHTSLFLGILLCKSCAIIHQTLIPEISEIVHLDGKFQHKDLQWLQMGGNASLKCFMAMYSISCNDSIEYKYRTKACLYYKKLLEMKVLHTKCTIVTPSLSEGADLDDTYLPARPPIPPSYSRDTLQKAKSKRRKTSFARAFRSIEAAASTTYSSVKRIFRQSSCNSRS